MTRKVTEDFIGTCQVCFGEYKVNEFNKLVVLHGYKRPGYGWVEGQCSGCGELPFEYDFEVTKRTITQHIRYLDDQKKQLAALLAGKVIHLTYSYTERERYSGRAIERHETIDCSHKEWEHTFKKYVFQYENTIRYVTRVIDFLKAKVNEWQPGTIVGIDTPATGKARALRKAYDPDEEDAKKERDAEKAKRDAKPGKLRVKFYRIAEKLPRINSDDYELWQAQREAKASSAKKWREDLKSWAKNNFGTLEGKIIVREEYYYRNDGNDYDSATVILPWDARTELPSLLEGAVKKIDRPKEIEYLVEKA